MAKILDPTTSLTSPVDHSDHLVGLNRTYLLAVGQAVFVTFLWSTSWIIIKFGLEELPPLLFSGLRYFIAAVTLIFVVISQPKLRWEVREIITGRRRVLAPLVLYGVVFIALTQGAMFVSLLLLPAITVTMVLNLTPVLVLLLSTIIYKSEKLPPNQLLVVVVGLFGLYLYFFPLQGATGGSGVVGIAVALLTLIFNASSALIGRGVNRAKVASPLVVTCVSMLFGSLILLAVALMVETVPPFSMMSVVFILSLAFVNTAFAFTIWNKTMQTLRATDSSLINSLMLPQIVLWSVLFLAESPTGQQWVGIVLLASSIITVQLLQSRK